MLVSIWFLSLQNFQLGLVETKTVYEQSPPGISRTTDTHGEACLRFTALPEFAFPHRRLILGDHIRCRISGANFQREESCPLLHGQKARARASA